MVRHGDLGMGSREGVIVLNRAIFERPDPLAVALWPSVAPADDGAPAAGGGNEDDLSSAGPPDAETNGDEGLDDEDEGDGDDKADCSGDRDANDGIDEDLSSSLALPGDNDSFCTSGADGGDNAPASICVNVSLLSPFSCSARILDRIVMRLGVRSRLFCASAGLFVGVGRFGISSPACSLLDLLSVESMAGDHQLPELIIANAIDGSS